MSLNFDLNPAQCELRASAREFARETLRRVRGTIESLPTPASRFRATRPFYEALVSEGFLRRMIPQPFGGEGAGTVDMAIIAEEFYAEDVNVPLTAFANLLGLMPVFVAGTPAQQDTCIAPFLTAKGAPLAALASSEPGGSANYHSSADGGGVRTQATLDGDNWVINGAKQWISNAAGWDGKGADLLAVVCRTAPVSATSQGVSVLLAPGPLAGFSVHRDHDSLGHRAHLTSNIRFENVRVPRDNIVGEAGVGLNVVDASFAATAALVGIMSLGVMRAAFDFALHFAKTERRGGPMPIIEHQAVGYALADAKATIEAVRGLSYRACFALDQQAANALELSLQAKVFGSESAVRVITDLMRVVGIDSYDHSTSPLAAMLQDAMAFPLFDGGNMGVRRRQLHEMMMSENYDSLSTVLGS